MVLEEPAQGAGRGVARQQAREHQHRVPDFPVPIGVLSAIDAPVYEDVLLGQEQRAISERGPGDIAKLLMSGETWKIG